MKSGNYIGDKRELRKRSNYPVAINISRLISEKGLKQADVARSADIQPRNLSDILNGYKIVRANEILKLAVAIGVSVGELFSEKQESGRWQK